MKKKPNRLSVSSLFITTLCVAALALVATLPGGGWWFGAQVQNVSNSTASVTYTLYDFASNTYSRSDNIDPGASINYALNNFSLPNNFQGSSKANSNQDIRAIVNLTTRGVVINGTIYGDTNSPSPAAGQYQGMVAGNTTLRFPLVKIDYYNKSTTIVVQNAGTGSATATASFTFGNTIYNYYTPTIGPGKMAIIEPIYARNGNNHPPTNSYGSLTVTSSQPLTGIALEHLTGELHATALQATRGFTISDFATTVYAPITKNNYYNRFTGLQVQNVSGGSVNMTITYVAQYEASNQHNPLGCKGGTFHDYATGVAANAFYTFGYPSTQLPQGCFASATVLATGNVIAVVNEAYMKSWLNTNPGQADEVTAYNAIPNGFATNILSAPLFKEDSYSKGTAISIENVGAIDATKVVIKLTGPTGIYTSNPLSISHGSAYVAFDLRLKPASFWNGTALTPAVLGCQNNTTGCGANGVFSVIVTSDQNIVGVANESTYPNTAPRINQDKSNYEAFNLTQVP
jgi:hypothetical protein